MKAMVLVDLQNDDGFESVPEPELLQNWIEASLLRPFDNLEQTIRIVDIDEGKDLNHQYRGKNSPTNILSFESEADHIDYDYLGDLVVCHPVVIQEAKDQCKTLEAHWAHMIVHGMLHLQGLDHQNDDDALEMEAVEVKILSTLGYASPYNNH